MKKFTVTLNAPFDSSIEAKLKDLGVSYTYSAELNPYLIFVQATDISVLENLDYVAKLRESRTYNLYV